ncbi:hypothetical protein [Streptomyces griseorubiginosus]
MATVAEPAEQLLYRPEEASKALRIGCSLVYEENVELLKSEAETTA